jgi:hypothetical protein
VAAPIESRSPYSRGSANKCTQTLDVPVGDELYDAVVTEATLKRVSKAEMVREILERHYFGELGRMRRSMHVPEDGAHPNNIGST